MTVSSGGGSEHSAPRLTIRGSCRISHHRHTYHCYVQPVLTEQEGLPAVLESSITGVVTMKGASMPNSLSDGRARALGGGMWKLEQCSMVDQWEHRVQGSCRNEFHSEEISRERIGRIILYTALCCLDMKAQRQRSAVRRKGCVHLHRHPTRARDTRGLQIHVASSK